MTRRNPTYNKNYALGVMVRVIVFHWYTLSHNVVSSTPHLTISGILTINVSGDWHWLHR